MEFKVLLSLLEKEELPDAERVDEILDKTAQILHQKHGHFDVDKMWINHHQLYQVLCLNLEGKALSMIKNLQGVVGHNGILGWCRLTLDCTSLTAQRLQGLASKVYHPKRCKTYAEVPSAIEDWELQAGMFAKAEWQRDNKLNDITRMFSLRQILPEELEKTS